MTPDQTESRDERVAIMTVCGKCSVAAADAFCDTMPELYGIRDLGAHQVDLFGSGSGTIDAL